MDTDYARIEAAIRYIEATYRQQPTLDAIAAHIGLSPYHFHRLFTRWAGITPKRFVQVLTVDYARHRLHDCASVLQTALDSGLSGPGRLHDLLVTHEAITPGQMGSRGAGLTIDYGFDATPFGGCLLGVSERGIVALSFVDNGCEDAALDALRHDWPAAAIRHAPAATEPLVERIFAPTGSKPGGSPLPVYLAGTNFQVKVWRALLAIPPGALVSYGALAAAIGQPKAARAVGTTVGANAISFLIPCHRVIRSTGVTTGYRWGDTRKRAMHVWEAGHFTSS